MPFEPSLCILLHVTEDSGCAIFTSVDGKSPKVVSTLEKSRNFLPLPLLFLRSLSIDQCLRELVS